MPELVPSAEPDLVRHVTASTGLAHATAVRVIADVLAYFDETVEEFVRRRHQEMKLRRLKNAEIWSALSAEMAARRFGAPELTERQLRRIVYG